MDVSRDDAGGEFQYWREVEAVFAEAVAADAATRGAVLDARCGGRADLRAEVESLLEAHARAGESFAPFTLDRSAVTWPVDSRPEVQAGSRVGAFRLLERIAQGGMGDVYRAERAEDDFVQQVAVKLIAARLEGAETVRRFRAERQILATLQHPNIVALLDGGLTPDGQPYIAMEYVDGLPITQYCEAHTLALDARLRLFLQVTAAVRIAHRNLVVHRDLKPANVLVTGDGLVKVLDFGVAKLLQPQIAPPFATASLLGPMTPNYASPEQLRGLPVTTASDVYALGVMLYELVAGRRPYETAGKAVDEIVSIVVDQEPVRPSAAPPGGVPYDPRRLRGDLDAIVLKALAKDPDHRYASAEELGDDVSRFLAGKPVVAREPSFAYLARKTIARHTAAFAVAGVFLVLLVAALIGAIWQARVAAAERERAVARFNDVRELAGALIFKIHDEVAPLAGSTPVRRTVIAEGLKFLERLGRDAAGDPTLQVELARAYIRIGQVQLRTGEASLGDRDGAIRSYRTALNLVAPRAGSGARSWEPVLALTDANLALAGVLEGDDRRSAATAAFAAASAWHTQEPQSVRARALLARAHCHMAGAAGHPDSLAHWLAADRLFAALLAEDPGDSNKMRNAALVQKQLGAYFEEADDLARALEHHQRAYVLDEKRVQTAPDNHVAQLDLAIDISNIGTVHMRRKEYTEAIDAYRRSLEIRERLAAADPKNVQAQGRLAFLHTKLATLHARTGRLPVARDHARRAVTLIEPLSAISRGYRADLLAALKTLADIEREAGRRQEACAIYGKAQRVVRAGDELSPSDLEMKSAVERAVDACRTW